MTDKRREAIRKIKYPLSIYEQAKEVEIRKPTYLEEKNHAS